MPQKVYDNFYGGISFSDRIGQEGSYAAGTEIDPCDEYFGYSGYLMPGRIPSSIGGGTLVDAILDFEIDSINNAVYGISNKKIQKISIGGVSDTILTTSPFPYALTACGANYGYDVCLYPIGTSNKLFYTWQKGTASGQVGMYDLSSSFDDDYMGTSPANPFTLSAAQNHPMLIGEDGKLYIGNGRKLVSFDGQTGAYGTVTQVFSIPQGYDIVNFFRIKNYLGITASKTTGSNYAIYGDSQILFWDYISKTWNQAISVNDNIIKSIYNQEGNVFMLTAGRDRPSLRRLTDNGTERLHYLKIWVDSIFTECEIVDNGYNCMDVFNNKIIFGANDYIFYYGKVSPLMRNALYCVSKITGDIKAIKNVSQDRVYISVANGANYSVQRYGYDQTKSTNAVWKGLWTYLGRKVRINYIKYYFKPLSSGDSVTPRIELDNGGTSELYTLRDPRSNSTISYTNDGAVKSKKFNVNRDCYAFKPCLYFDGGGVAFDRIVIDYTYIEDN